MVTSGVRVGTPALTTRGLGVPESERIADWIAGLLDAPDDAAVHASVRGRHRPLRPVPGLLRQGSRACGGLSERDPGRGCP